MRLEKKRQLILLIGLVILLFIINYSFLDKALKEFLIDYETAIVKRVIDGDTFVIDNATSVRLLGINTPERGEIYYKEAKDFLENFSLNKTVGLEFGKEKKDKYGRTLAYVIIDNKNINLELVKNGFANFYFPSGKDIYYEKFKKAWEICIKEEKNLCEKTKNKCAECIELKEFDYKNQIIVFYDKCDFDCELTGWGIKDEGRKKFIFPKFNLKKWKNVEIKVGEGKENETILFWKGEEYVWTKSGDSLFLRDKDGKLVLWKSY